MRGFFKTISLAITPIKRTFAIHRCRVFLNCTILSIAGKLYLRQNYKAAASKNIPLWKIFEESITWLMQQTYVANEAHENTGLERYYMSSLHLRSYQVKPINITWHQSILKHVKLYKEPNTVLRNWIGSKDFVDTQPLRCLPFNSCSITTVLRLTCRFFSSRHIDHWRLQAALFHLCIKSVRLIARLSIQVPEDYRSDEKKKVQRNRINRLSSGWGTSLLCNPFRNHENNILLFLATFKDKLHIKLRWLSYT